MANREKMTMGLMVLLATLMLSGCVSYKHSFSDKFSIEKIAELERLPIGIKVTNIPNPVSAQLDAGPRKYIWRLETQVSAIDAPVRITEFGGFVWSNDKWYFVTIYDRPFTAKEFEEWYSCPGAKLTKGNLFSDHENWMMKRDSLVARRFKLYYIGVRPNGQKVKGEAIVECLPQIAKHPIAMASESSGLFKVHSVWQGTCSQTNVRYSPYPMILFINKQKGDSFEGMTWYPTLNNGVVKVSGRIRPENVVTFTEDKVIHGYVVSGTNYTATIEGNILKGSYKFGKIHLKSGFLSAPAYEPSDLFKVHSVWQGTSDLLTYNLFPMILFIKNRKGETFEGTTWYPTLNNGLIKVSGQIRPENVVTFTEDEVLHGTVVSGCKYTATLEENTLKGGYDWVVPGSSKVVKGNILLKRAD